MLEEYQSSRGAPPLKVWVLALLWVLAAVLVYVAASQHIQRALVQQVRERLSANRQGALVLVFGNSLGCAAVNPGLRQLPSGEVVDIRAVPFKVAWRMTADDIRQLATELKAELVLVQSDVLLTTQRHHLPDIERTHFEYQFLVSHRGSDIANCRQSLGAQLDLTPAFLQSLIVKYERSDARLNDRSVGDITALGTAPFKLALIRVPRSQSFEAALPYLAGHRAELEARFAAAGLPVFVPDRGQWPDHYFLDFRHLNEAGAEQYTQWLLRELPRLRAAPP